MFKNIPDGVIAFLWTVIWTLISILSTGDLMIGDYKLAIPLQLRVLVFLVGIACWAVFRYYWRQHKLTSPKRFDRAFTRSLRNSAGQLREGAALHIDVNYFNQRIPELRAAAREFYGNKDICGMIDELEAASLAHAQAVREAVIAGTNTRAGTDQAVIEAADRLLDFTKWAAIEPKQGGV